MGDMDGDFTVYTQYDAEADFAHASTYYLPDSILTTGGGMQASYWSDENAQRLVAQVESEMNERGYVRDSLKVNADLGVQLTYVENTVNLVGYVDSYWGGWWDIGYWGPFWGGGWYYPYPVSYQYNTGSIILEIVDLRQTSEETSEHRLPVIWYANSEGLLSGSSRVNLTLIQRAIAQSFEQSSYIQKQ